MRGEFFKIESSFATYQHPSVLKFCTSTNSQRFKRSKWRSNKIIRWTNSVICSELSQNCVRKKTLTPPLFNFKLHFHNFYCYGSCVIFIANVVPVLSHKMFSHQQPKGSFILNFHLLGGCGITTKRRVSVPFLH